jgi:2-polyprenyl-3-methyl-5-hydroxy-6-metoxy-1,4-benzoquinol methylase
MTIHSCRFCGAELHYTFADLGVSPLANSYLTEDQLSLAEPFYPLRVRVCERCFLVQLEEFASPEHIFEEYAYFSSYSDTWLDHARQYTEKMIERFHLSKESQVIEIASNDGYLLQFFLKRGIPVLGIEPARNVAQAARQKGIPTVTEFFGVKTAETLAASGKGGDLLIGNNVLAHVPELNDFVAGMKILLGPHGVITMEFPHLMRLISGNQFDTIYHEHFSYFSFLTVREIFARHELAIFDVEELTTHGGSLRIYAMHERDTSHKINWRVEELSERESVAGFRRIDMYLSFMDKVRETKRRLLSFLIEAKQAGKSVVSYGAPAKGNTLLNYCGIRTDFLDYTVDASPHKQNHFLPGTRIPIHHPEKIKETRPDYVLILPWNLREEITAKASYIRNWGGQFIIPIPQLEVIR